MKIALFPGTFDPITIGHVNIVLRALPLFDRIYVHLAVNGSKNPLFDLDKRMKWVDKVFENEPKVHTTVYGGLTVDACKKVGAKYLIRGIRYVSDFESEKMIADVNRRMGIETVFFTCLPEHSFIASTVVRELLKNGGDITPYVPAAVIESISL